MKNSRKRKIEKFQISIHRLAVTRHKTPPTIFLRTVVKPREQDLFSKDAIQEKNDGNERFY
jgi:hypothetical protein